MIRLNAAYSKKLPGEQPYSSEGVSLSVEVELPDQVLSDPHQFSDAVRRLFGQARAEVELQTRPHGANGAMAATTPLRVVGADSAGHAPAAIGTPANGRGSHLPASTIRGVPPIGAGASRSSSNGSQAVNGRHVPASKKQLDFLISLAKRHGGLSPSELLHEAGVRSLSEIGRDQASALIERFSAAGAPR